MGSGDFQNKKAIVLIIFVAYKHYMKDTTIHILKLGFSGYFQPIFFFENSDF